MRTTSQVEAVVSGFKTLEGPAFDRDGNLFFVDWDRSSVMKMTPDGETSEYFNTGGIPAGLAFHPDGSLWVADEGENIHGILRIDPDGTSKVVVNEFEGVALNGANDLVFDRNGVLYFSDPWGSNDQSLIGGFYRLFPDGTLEQIATGLAFPNGVALNADESAVFLAETYRNRIVKFALDKDKTIGPMEHFANTEVPPGADGMAFDVNGDLYVAHFSGSRVDIFNPAGSLVDTIAVPGKQPTNVAFGGTDNKTLVITECETGTIYKVELSVAGQRLNDGLPS